MKHTESFVEALYCVRHSPLLLTLGESDGNPRVICSLTIEDDFSWVARIKEKYLPCTSTTMTTIPEKLASVADVKIAMDALDTHNLCGGNKDDKYKPIVDARNGVFLNASGNILVTKCMAIHVYIYIYIYIYTYIYIMLLPLYYGLLLLCIGEKTVAFYDPRYQTIRCDDCHLLIPQGLECCPVCHQTLNRMLHCFFFDK